MSKNMIDVLNGILASSSADYQNYVPVATRNNLSLVANPILTYSIVKNEFVTALMNKVVLSVVHKKLLNNPLAPLKRGVLPLGQDVEEIHVNRAKGDRFDPTGADLLTRTKPNAFVTYHRLNRQDTYQVSISDDQLRQAFTSYENLQNLIDAIINSLYSADTDDEFILMKQLVSTAVSIGHVPIIEVPSFSSTTGAAAEVQKLTISAACTVNGSVDLTVDGVKKSAPLTTTQNSAALVAAEIRKLTFTGWTVSGTGAEVILTAGTTGAHVDPVYDPKATGAAGAWTTTAQGVNPTVYDGTALKAIVGSFKNTSSYMSFAGDGFNKYSAVNPGADPIRTKTEVGDQVLLIRADLANAVDIEVLAAAFNLDKVTFLANRVLVDSFGTDTKIVAMIADKSFFQVYDQMRKTTEFYNPKGLYTNFYHHVWQIMSYSLMVNSAVFRMA